MTPLLDAAVYYLIFGVLLSTRRGVHNYIAFLVIGVFVFRFIHNSIVAGARAISGNSGLLRALHFPRIVLPLAATLVSGRQLLASLIVLVPIVITTGEQPTARWLLLLPALLLQGLFCAGLACITARVGAGLPDLAQIVPFVLRIWLYLSGIFYSIDALARTYGNGWIRQLLASNPAAIFVDLARDALLAGNRHVGSHEWWQATGWAGLVAALGYLYFWHGEERYGRT